MNRPDHDPPSSFGEGDFAFDQSHGREHQPPDPSDLARHPPDSSRCALARGLLRDYCDGELEALDRRQVEEHAHACRGCALALARCERERLLVDRAFDEDRAAAADMTADGAGEDTLAQTFRRRVLAEVSAIMLEEQETPPQFTGRVMERVRLEWHRVPSWRRALVRFGAFRAVLVAAVLVAAAFVLGRASTEDDAVRDPGFVVREARGAVVVAGGVSTTVADGGTTILPPDHELVLDETGSARLILADGDGDGLTQKDRARILLTGGDHVRALARGGLELIDGAPRIAVADRFTLTLPGPTVLALGPGSYDVAARHVRRFDALIGAASSRLRIEVAEGVAELHRGGLEPLRIGAGKVLHVAGADVEVEDAPSAELLARHPRIGTRDLVADAAQSTLDGTTSWTGRIVDSSSGHGIAAASVELVTRTARIGPLASDADGWFRFSITDAREAYVTVRVAAPHGGDVEYAAFGPAPLPLRNGSPEDRSLRIALDPDLPLRGVIVDDRGAGVANARVTPCVVDELFALVDRLEDASVSTGADGSFALRGLPASLDARQVLAVLVEARGRPRVARIPQRGPDATGTLRIALADARVVALSGLPADRSLRVLQEVPGLPLAAVADAFDVRSDPSGSAELRGVGTGSLWLVEGENGERLRSLAADGDRAFVASAEAAPGRLLHQMKRLRSLAQGIDSSAAGVAMATRGTRFERSRAVPPSKDAAFLDLREDGRPVSGATRVFVERADGSVEFVGEWDGRSVLAFDPPADRPFRVFAVGNDGSVGVLESTAFDAGNTAIEVAGHGSAEAPDALRVAGQGLCVFELMDGPCAGQRFWRSLDPTNGYRAEGLLPGTYRVVLPDGRSAACTIAAGRSAFLAPVARANVR